MAGETFLDIVSSTPTQKRAIQTSAGAGDAGKIVGLDASGRFDSTVMPVGIGANTASITASEALSAGDFVNIWNSTGSKARKADASVQGKEAWGFVLAGVSNGATATVYLSGPNTGVTGHTPGPVFLSATTPGAATATAPSGSGQMIQSLGIAFSATAINFVPVVIAKLA